MRYPVLIAGGGSVGLCLAAELAWRGVPSLIVEERDDLNRHPRANAVANRTMEYFRRWGIDEAVTNAGIPPSLPAEYLWVTTLHGREIHRISLPPYDELVARRARGGYAEDEHAWSPYLKTITGQDEVEAAVLDYLRSRPEATVRFGWRLVEFTDATLTTDATSTTNGNSDGDSEAGVTAVIESTTTGERQTITADFLVGCDGGRSAVRRRLGINLSGRPDLASFVSVYFHAPDLIEHHSFGHGNIFFPLHRDHRGFFLTWDDDKTYTYHLVLDEGQAWESVDPVEAITSVVGGESDDDLGIEIRSVQPWTAHALVADEYRRGRVFLAGDAAHLFSPTGGFGMNTGVSDAIDLAWKLDAALAGWAGPGLLDSYQAERRPIGIRNTCEAADCFDRLFAVMQNGDELDDEGPEADALRAELAADIKDQEKLIASSGTLLGYRYEGSPLVLGDGTPEPPDDPRRYLPVARPGHRAPHVWLDEPNGVALYDRLGPGHTLLCLGVSADRDDVQALVSAAADRGMPLAVLEVHDPLAIEVYEEPLCLVRPDLMLAWRGADIGDPVALVDTVRGA